ncbi:MAG: pyridoxamine 5'-phosphate oxidase family protein [Nitrospira sp.]
MNTLPGRMDSLRVLSPKRVVWLNVTGSGNETSAHVQQDPRMTLMFCAFEGSPVILRLYGTATVVHQGDAAWRERQSRLSSTPGARQIFDVTLDLVQTSCGMAVPYLSYTGDRELLNEWAGKKGEEGLRRYWAEKNQLSLDDLPTNIVKKSRSQ